MKPKPQASQFRLEVEFDADRQGSPSRVAGIAGRPLSGVVEGGLLFLFDSEGEAKKALARVKKQKLGARLVQ